jgi:hypothetical protein
LAAPPWHVPPWQVSPTVHALPSVQAVPSGSAEPLHVPVAGLHVWAPWHWSATQVFGLLPVQTPDWQVSVCVQALLSLHAVPFITGVCTQPDAGLQLSAVQGLLSSQLSAALWQAPPEQVPACGWQASGDGHAVPSAFWQAPVALHALHAPQALLEQQKPSVQKAPATHSSPVAQVAPSGFLPQVLPTHVLGATQSEFCVQVCRQLAPPLHMNGEHWCVPPPTLQLPAPSHVFARFCVDAFIGHDGPTHCVPAGHLRHAPAPSHLPSLAHVEAAVTPH